MKDPGHHMAKFMKKIKKEEMGINGKEKIGQLMSQVMKELKNKADGKLVKEIVESFF